MKKSVLMMLVALGAIVAFANSNLNWKISSSPYDFDLAGVCVYKGTTLVDIVGLVSASPVSPGTETEDSWVDISDYLDGYKFSIALFHEDADDIQPTYESVARYTYTDLLNRGVVKVSQMDGRSYVARAANMAARKGMLVCNAAGNEGDDDAWKIIITPADADSVLTVGGIDNYLNVTEHAHFASYGLDPATETINYDALEEQATIVLSDITGGVGR